MNNSSVISILKKHRQHFHPVVPCNAGDRIIGFDLTEKNELLTHKIVENTRQFSAYIHEKLNSAQARYGIGGYNEHRTVYSRSRVFDAASPGEEPRRLHLGTDIWGKSNTAVMAPLDGIVHSFAFNNSFGDYGATILLTHQLEGTVFHTLYGHLSLNSIKNLQEGERIGKGDVFAEFGIPVENGHWPPHLHFQLIIDTGEWKGDYPGVCKYSEKEKWLENCPDPELILNMNQLISQ